MQKKIYVIINPVSGTKSKKEIPEKVATHFDQHKYEIHIFLTGYAGHATEIAVKAVKDKVDCVIAVGGDGTVNEVAKALVNTDVVFGIVPSGSGNGLARELHIPLNTTKAIEILSENNVKTIDYGVANGEIFFCTCGVGFDALISEKALEQSSRGKLMYAQSIISSLINFKPQKYKITTENGTFEDKAFLVTCANASQYGNDAFIAPHADICDGKMNLAIVRPLSVIEVPQAAIQIFTKNIDNNAKVTELLTSEATIEREEEGVMHLDGNASYTGKKIHVKIVHQGLKVLVPTNIPKKKIDPQAFISNITRWI
ncbi:diacylglycerol kinase family protein [Dysgonomonas sp. 520]|uniref:diacylglycerol/lipid kinase family protein n=1 Tax=Dysgonomonas sp. 520 TaxID=2302931 RepID=UPI0013D3A19B|nr:diacylglycerol kinase family protein [Dysgonomonas sp. 520]NDW11021.1 diacylglycerol kinase family lipid kinase [Dysgonomonas sp. 520]